MHAAKTALCEHRYYEKSHESFRLCHCEFIHGTRCHSAWNDTRVCPCDERARFASEEAIPNANI